MNVALIADWLPVFGGAEHVIAELHSLFPDAPIFTTVANTSKLGPLQDADIRTSSLQKWYRLTGKHQVLLPWMPKAIEDIDLRGFDVVISSSHAVGKGVIPPSSAVHICYCHTPMRYAWEMEQEYLKDFRVPRVLQKPIRKQLKNLRRWDLTTAKRVDHFIANSTTTQERIQRIYNRESTVIHPPVSLKTHGIDRPKEYFFAIGRLVPYKRFDLLIEAANALQIPLKIAGSGDDFDRLKRMAGPTVELLGFVPQEQLVDLYTGAHALLFPQFEDAGVVPLEAQMCGTPVIAFGKGGALDTVKDGATGLFFAEQTVASLRDALERFKTMQFDTHVIHGHAQQFSDEKFRTRISEFVTSCSN